MAPTPSKSESPQPEDPKWDELRARSTAANLKFSISPIAETNFFVALVHITEHGSERLPLVVWDQNISKVLSVEFEKFQLVGGYHAISSASDRQIEAFVEPAVSTLSVRSIVQQLLGGEPEEFLASLEAGGVKIKLGAPSNELVALAGSNEGSVRSPDGTSIRVSGLPLLGTAKPRTVLEKFSDALLFQFDTRFQQPIVLCRSQKVRLPFSTLAGEGGELTFPKSEFDHEPMSLYWYARSAQGLPLLEFFAYYQILEFYYEQYVDAEGRRKIAQVLKNPSFSPHNERHLARVLGAAGRGSANRRNERDQLLTTIRGCADTAEIRSFLKEDDGRKKFFEEKDPKLTQKSIHVSAPDNELLTQIADRIYDLRCKIVHTKEGGNGDGVELLLPHSPEADRLHMDIDLLRLIARQALIAGSRPMNPSAS